MTDEELAAEVLPDVPLKEALAAVRKLTPEMRANYERIVMAGRLIRLWEEGLGPLPPGVIVCR